MTLSVPLIDTESPVPIHYEILTLVIKNPVPIHYEILTLMIKLTSTMEVVKTFLESSTIHGLSYISRTRKYSRLFWTLVVMTGFITAGFMIKESLQGWSESPVKTAVETLPITDLKFPKVTVCPPKKTYTDLNYDMLLAENMSLTEEMKDELYKFALHIINNHTYMDDLNMLKEYDRYYNWYNGLTKIRRTYYDSNYDYDTDETTWVGA